MNNRKWEKKFTTSVGLGPREEYYVNLETGETDWERPDEYESEDEREKRRIEGLIAFDKTSSVETILQQLNISSNVLGQTFKLALEGDDSAWKELESKLEQLLLCFNNAGGPEEWIDIFAKDGFELPQCIARLLKTSDETNVHYQGLKVYPLPPKLRSSIFQIWSIFTEQSENEVDKQFRYISFVTPSWSISYELFIYHVEEALKYEIKNQRENGKGVLHACLSVFYGVLTYGPTIPETATPSDDFVKYLLECATIFDEEQFLLSVKVFVALCSHTSAAKLEDYDVIKIKVESIPAILVSAFRAFDENKQQCSQETVAEGLLFLLNNSHYPYQDATFLEQLLHCFKLVLQSKKSCNFFRVNDFRSILDMVLLEIHNLPSKDQFRVEYLILLFMVIANSPWRNHGRYKRADVLIALDFVLDNAHTNLLPAAVAVAQKILLNCGDQLV